MIVCPPVMSVTDENTPERASTSASATASLFVGGSYYEPLVGAQPQGLLPIAVGDGIGLYRQR